MTTKTGSKALYWIITLISLVAVVALLIIKAEWFWVPLPFFLTYFVKAIGKIDED